MTSTLLPGVHLITPALKEDERGAFGRTWDLTIAKEHSLQEYFDYTCISTNHKQYTLRGMHYQTAPHGEVKLVRCTKGSIFDVVIDLRPDSQTYKQWMSAELTAENHQALYIPIGCAHGFLTLEDETEVLYALANEYKEDAAKGIRWDDPAFAIQWPSTPIIISDRDAAYPDFAA